jgi:hypothetical protein
MTLVPFRRIEEFASFLAAHLTGEALVIRRPIVLIGRRSTGCRSGRRLAGTARRLIAL